MVARPAAAEYTLTTLASFDDANGSLGNGNLILDATGNLYGTTSNGGPGGSGTVFKLASKNGVVTTLADSGGSPGLARDAAGNLFGTADSAMGGVVFEVAAGSGTVSTLASLNGASPGSGLVRDAAGNLYGTAIEFNGATMSGSVFELATGGTTITTLVHFNAGSFASDRLLLDATGNLYGTARDFSGHGILFEIARGSGTLTTLATFDGGSNGSYPNGNLIRDASGNLYGTTQGLHGDGTVFTVLAGSGSITTLATFGSTGHQPDGSNPPGGLVLDSSGNLFGVTGRGGPDDVGTLFEVVAGSGVATTLATFNGANGAYPQGGLVIDASGNIYGATQFGGANNVGTVFVLTPSSAVPEPTAMLMLGQGVLAAAVLTWRARVRRVRVA